MLCYEKNQTQSIVALSRELSIVCPYSVEVSNMTKPSLHASDWFSAQTQICQRKLSFFTRKAREHVQSILGNENKVNALCKKRFT